MIPARRDLLTRAVDLIRAASNAEAFDVAATRAALIRLGALFIDGKINTMKLSGVTAALDFDNGEQLILRWAANARAALAEGTDANAATEEEE